MKSKAEVIDALKRCKVREWSCDECSYFPLGDHCWDMLHSDLLFLLNKSDFEVAREMLKRSENMWYTTYVVMSGHKVIEIHDRSKAEIIHMKFDEEGNIL